MQDKKYISDIDETIKAIKLENAKRFVRTSKLANYLRKRFGNEYINFTIDD